MEGTHSKRLLLLAPILLLAVCLLVMVVGGNRLTVARCVVTDTGQVYMAYHDRPVLLSSVEGQGYHTGDLLLILHSTAFAESYPEQTRALFALSLAGGDTEDVPTQVMDVLTQPGNRIG